MPVTAVVTQYGAAALDALVDAVADAKSGDPLRPVTVLAPNNVAGIVARRRLAVGLAGRSGVAGLEITTLARLAERIATPRLTPRRPAGRTVIAAAWRQVLADDPRCFRDIARHPATVRALATAHTELRDVSAPARETIKGMTPLARDLVELHDIVTARLAEHWYDGTDTLTVAAAHLPDLGVCIVYAPQELTRAETAFLDALVKRAEVTVILARTGVRRADAVTERTAHRLGIPDATADRIPVPTASRVITASDADDEIRCVVRDLMARLPSTPAHRIAVLYSAAVPYARVLHEQLSAAGITVNGAGVRAVDERAVARTLRELLALADDDVPRAELFRAIANAPTRDFDGERIPVARWERISRAAGVVAGDDWLTRLDVYLDELRSRVRQEEESGDRSDWILERLARDIDAGAALQRFATRLRVELQTAASMSRWSELADWTLALLTALVGTVEQLRTLPPEEQYAAVALTSLLRALASLDNVESSADLAALRDVLDAELGAALPRVGRFGDGVLVAPLSAAIGLDLDVVYVVGLSEDLYPGRVPSDALLPDRVRAATNGELPALPEQVHAKYRHLLAAFASAAESVASFPRGDLRRSSQRLPSRFLLPSLRELSGNHGLAATEWDTPTTYAGTVVNSGSFAAALLGNARPATDQEWRVRQAAVGELHDDVVRAAVAMVRARSSDEFTRYDGNLAEAVGLPDHATSARAISPTALEAYAECPHAYFVERLLGVKPLDQPEDVVTISPLDIGNLVHESVDALITEFGGELPGYGEPWTERQRQRLIAIANEKAGQFRDRGLTGHPRLWHRERVRILGDLEWLINDDDRWRRERFARVLASELPFGTGDRPAVEIPIPGGRVRMRGSADKVDQTIDGTLIVTDIKTGSDTRFSGITPQDPTAGGTKLQLPVYAYAARDRFGDQTTPVEAAYWFVRKGRRRKIIELTDHVEQEYARTLAVLVRSLAAGLFPARTPESADYGYVRCPYCNPDGVGYGDGRDRWERKRLDPALREYVRLVEPDALPGDDQ